MSGRRGWFSSFARGMPSYDYVESRDIHPIPIDERTDTRYNTIFFSLFSANFNIFNFALGAVAPQYGLGLRDACLAILFFNMACAIPPAYIATWGPKLGLRQMVQGRYVFGLYGVIFPGILNILTILGGSALSVMVGGQTLTSASNGHLSWTTSVVLLTTISLLLSFAGYSVLSWFERLVWLPIFAGFLVMVGVSVHHLTAHDFDVYPPNTTAILNYGLLLAAILSSSAMSSNLTCYFNPEQASFGIFLYAYLGRLFPTTSLQCFGAASALAAVSNPVWRSGLEYGNAGGLIGAMLQPVGRFGKFIAVVLALGVSGNLSMIFHSFGFHVQVILPSLISVPRYFFSVLATAVVIPVAIIGSRKFYHTLTTLLGLIAYWSASYVGIILAEHVIIRDADPDRYDIEIWNAAHYLPKGFAALSSMALALMMSVLSMHSRWFVGPISRAIGEADLGWELALVTGFIVYIPLRLAEVWWWGDVEAPRFWRRRQRERPDSVVYA